MSESESQYPAGQVRDKGSFYKKIAGGVSDTSEGGLEKIIFDDMVDRGWRAGDAKDYDREYCVDLVKLRDFLNNTQPKIAEELLLDSDNPTRRKFLARLEKEIGSRGVIDVIRRGIKVDQHDIELFYGTPSPGNSKSAELFAGNRFSVTRQLQYSLDESGRRLIWGSSSMDYRLRRSSSKTI